MTDQSRILLTDALIERMLAERAGRGAPADLVDAIATAVEATGQRAPGLLGAVLAPRTSRPRSVPGTSTFRRIIQVAAVAVAVVVVAIGAGLFLRLSRATIAGPTSPPLVAPAPSASAGPSSSPSPSPTRVARTPGWFATGSMGYERPVGATATLLPSGKVLVAGGGSMYVSGSSRTAELYDPGSGSWTATGSMASERNGATATLLPDGKVLVAGGRAMGSQQLLASAELYDPATGTWTPTGPMGAPRIGFTATLLPMARCSWRAAQAAAG